MNNKFKQGDYLYFMGNEAGGIETPVWNKGRVVVFVEVNANNSNSFYCNGHGDKSYHSCSNVGTSFRRATRDEVMRAFNVDIYKDITICDE